MPGDLVRLPTGLDSGAVQLLWPAVAVLGFAVLACVVIALGTSSTARYEFERNALRSAPQIALPAPAGAVPAAGEPAGRPAGASPRPAAGNGSPTAVQEMRDERGTAVGLAAHPAGTRVQPGSVPAWWLVDELGEHSGQILAGPFPDRVDADWAGLGGNLSSATRVAYGVRRADGAGLVPRQLPEDRDWLSDLGDQLDRLSEDWDALLTDEDSLTTLVVEVASALVEVGLNLHDCTGDGPAGGVCLTPEPGHRGIVVSWHRHDRMSLQQARGAALDAAVQRTMNAALADLLTQLGFGVLPLGPTGCSLVPVADQEG